MPKSLTIILWASPYESEHAFSAMRMAGAALQRGHRVYLHATGDGIHAFTVGQGAKGLPNIEAMTRDLVASGLNVNLWGSCLVTRGVTKEMLIPGIEVGSLRRLFTIVRESDVVLNLGS